MSDPDKSQGGGTVTHTEIVYGDRRRTDRAKISLPVRVRPSDAREDSFDEVVTTLNASRDGLYFTTACPSYQGGMLLHVTFPYSPGARSVDFLGQVVRIEQLPEGRIGVAVHLLTTILLGRADASASMEPPAISTPARLTRASARS